MYVIARSVLYSTAQKDEDGHETERRLRVLPTGAGALHTLPSKVSAFPLKSTAMQNDDEGHETEFGSPWLSMLVGELQEAPL